MQISARLSGQPRVAMQNHLPLLPCPDTTILYCALLRTQTFLMHSVTSSWQECSKNVYDAESAERAACKWDA